MHPKSELGAFLKSRRAALTPEEIGLDWYGERRRVRGLRREELAQLAGLSITYYTRLEQGRGGNVSGSVLDALARALRLTDDERMHLHELTGRAHDPRRRATPERVRPSIAALLTQVRDVPAILVGRRADVLAWNAMGHALYAPDLPFASPEDPRTRPNLVQRVFVCEYAQGFYVDWPAKARDAVAYLRMAAARYPDDPKLAGLIGELSMRNTEFARLWAGHNVGDCRNATRAFEHPQVGPLTLTEEVMPLGDDPGQRLMLVSAEPGSKSEASLKLLASLVATEQRERNGESCTVPGTGTLATGP